ncbi:Beclin-1-like protein [Acorus gramineus]|uniref:Beclin-1-like protein n=1 Tax=Acorus gramineus TaxID=55184 RepID=A0AAV9BJV3_ACOGR|nr:Beclin-1-like protein [Acorus gramineus]
MKEVSSSSPATDKKTIRDDPNLPRWVCQRCRQSLCVVGVGGGGVESHSDKFLNDSSRSGMQGSSLMRSSRMDHSFVVLPRQRNQGQGGVPPRPPKAMEESFVVLPPPAASVYKPETSPTESGRTRSPSPRANTFGFHSCVTVLNRASEISTGQTQVDQPLCLECMRVLCDEFDKEVEDVSRDIRAYEGCLRQMEGERSLVLSEADFLKEKAKVEEEQRRMEAAISETEKQIAKIDIDLMELESKSKLFKDLEEQ